MNSRSNSLSCVALALALVSPGTALGHAALLKAEPTRRAMLSAPPRQVRLWFSEPLEPEYADVTLSRDGAGKVATGKPRLEANDRKQLVLDLPVLAPGSYSVRFRVLSLDGHLVEGSHGFGIKAAAAPR